MTAKKSTKLCPHHFPNGTVFQLKDSSVRACSSAGEQGPDTFTVVNGIVRNGISSYVLKTGVIREYTGGQGFNINHVERIVKRGDGPVVIDHGWCE